MSVQLDPELKCEDERLGRLLDWWRNCVRLLGHLPGRKHFDPVAMKPLLPQIYMVDVVPPGRFRWRLLGTAITEMAGRDSTGRWFDEIYAGETLDNFIASFAAVAGEAQPMRSFGTFSFTDQARDYITFEALEIPLASDGRTVDIILGLGVSTRVTPDP